MNRMIPPSHFERVVNALGDLFKFGDFDTLIYRCTGQHSINDWAAEGPTRTIARDCIQGLEKEGLLLAFLARVLEDRRVDEARRRVILEAVPEAASLPDTPAAVGRAVSELEKAREPLGALERAAAVADLSKVIAEVREGVGQLEAYKHLHDALHGIQLSRFRELDSAARMLSNDPLQADLLRAFHEQVRRGHACAQDGLERLRGNGHRAKEQTWINTLGEAVRDMQSQLDTLDASELRFTLMVIRNLLAKEMPSTNEEIFSHAKGLKLQELAKALENVNAGASAPIASVENAASALRELRASLLRRVVEHLHWQRADNDLWVVDGVFLPSAAVSIDDFASYWRPASRRVRELADEAPADEWSMRLRRYGDQVGDELARLDGLRPGAGAVAARDDTAVLRVRYNAFSSEARFRFQSVDRSLKADCEALSKLSQPLEAVTEVLAHG